MLICRFINSDEAFFINLSKTAIKNTFTYCYNNPINQIDYYGFEPITISLAAVVALAKLAITILMLAYITYLITSILNDRNFKKSVSNAVSKVKSYVKSKFEGLIIALTAAFAIAKAQSKANKYEVHHIVAQNALRAKPARNQLRAVGIGINSSTNKVSIKYNLHKRLHTTYYYDEINSVINAAYNNGSIGAKQRIIDTLIAIKEILLAMSASTP